MTYWKAEEYKTSFKHVKALTAHWAKSFYFSAHFLPKEQRWATYALYGFCRFADNLIDSPRKRPKAQIINEISCFNRELKLAFRNCESEHPILKPFIVVAMKYNIPIDYPLDLIKGVQMDIEISRYETFDDLYVFCYRVASVVGLMMTHVMGYEDKEAFEYAEKLGIAMQLTNILRDIKEDKEMGRIYLPQEELHRYNLSDEDVIQENFSDDFRKFMKFQIKRANNYYKMANKGVAMLNKDSQFSIYAASRIYQGILKRLEANEYNPFSGRVFVPTLQKVYILLSEILRSKKRSIWKN